jgi:hypothetical protein
MVLIGREVAVLEAPVPIRQIFREIAHVFPRSTPASVDIGGRRPRLKDSFHHDMPAAGALGYLDK